MKRRWNLVAVFGVLVVLLGGYLYLQLRPKPASTSAAQTQIVKMDQDKLVKVVLSRSTGNLVLEKSGKDWKLDYPYPINLSTSSIEGVASTIADLTAQQVIEENPTDLAQFGLKPPRVTVTASQSDGVTKTLYLGDKTPSGDSYYLQAQGDPKVYTVGAYVGNQFAYTVADFRDRALTPAINGDEVTYMRVKERGGQVIELKEKTADEQKSIALGLGKFLMTQPYPYPLGTDSDKADAFVKAPTSVQITDFVDDNPKSLAPYGLDHPWGELTVRDKANTLGLQFGADKDKDHYYFKIVGQPGVYTVDKSSVSFMDQKAFDLVDKFAFIPSIENVDRIVVTAAGKTHELVIQRTVKKAEKAGDADQTVATYTADGKSVEEGQFKGFYEILIGLQVEGELTKTVSGTPEITFRYFMNTGDQREVLVSFIPYNTDFDAVSVNGKGTFAISRTQLAGMLTQMDKFLRGEKVQN